ncbi:OpgC domain-containing protein [Bradyrhizobium aeschynomenes]|uniref:OpgC domain-containing protein n=1 Tax=Bradyrhizobium aeschynomenes TaxID=2734909 RepID=UPI001556F3A9|nr:OpgC domain-containing protein [Bradyrhizobium aeschynomenes]NPV22828.1 OpgC domain-containing protein [Bradyrhizobium aeschynomenes]
MAGGRKLAKTDGAGETGDGRRDLRLDACRGLALWFIFVDHVPDNSLAWLTLRNYGFSDTSEVFVFISGYTCMLAYGGALPKQGWATTIVRALRRAWEIYAAFLVLLLAYAALVWFVGGGTRFVDETNTGFFFREPGPTLLHVALLQFAPVNTDILLTFAILHICFPLILWMMMTSATLTLVLSVLLYMMVQLFSWQVPAWPSGELYFNPFAWQLLFVIGAWYAHGGAARLRPVLSSRTILIVALGYLAFSLFVALSWEFKSLEGLIPSAVTGLIYPIYKSHLAPVRLLHFFALALVVSRLAPPQWRGPIRPLTTAMIRCGENSLSMYCLGVLLAFIGQVLLTDVFAGFAMQLAISVAGIAIMIGAATLLTWESQLDRRGPRLF